MPAKLLGIETATPHEVEAMLKAKGLKSPGALRRMVAYFIDVSVTCLSTYWFLVTTDFGHLAVSEATGGTYARIAFLMWAWIVLPIYYAICIAIARKTAGCWLTGISIITTTGERPSFMRACLREWIMGNMTAIFFPLLIGLHTIYILVKWRGKRLKMSAWDAASQTVVV